jgi:hypothetical protein
MPSDTLDPRALLMALIVTVIIGLAGFALFGED